jgi:hypothetical protein
MAKMSEEELLKILKEEETDAASYYTSEMAKDQAEAMQRFYGEKYGDEVEGRSQITTHDIEDCINWMMPDLMRVFMASDELVTIEPGSIEDEQPYDGKPGGKPITECAADYLDHIFFKDNDGETNLYDFAFDGLLQRRGVMRVAWEDPKPKPAKTLEGIAPDKLARYVEDPEYEILEQEQDPKTQLFTLRVKQTPKMGRVFIEAVAPEGFRISRRAKSVDTASYHGEQSDEFLADLIRQFPEKARDLAPDGLTASTDDKDDEESDPRKDARWQEEISDVARRCAASVGRKKVKLQREFVRIDYDGDNIVELRAIKRVGDTILENIEVEKSEYVTWTPLRVSHKDAGRSLADVLAPIQRARTVVLRRTLDGLAQALTPRSVVNTQMVGEEGVDDLIDNEIGGVIRTNGPVGDAFREVVTPDVSASGYQMLEYLDQRGDEASGVTRHSQGLDPSALNKTATGIDLLQAAAKSRVELIARWLGKGLQDVLERVLHLVCAHQDAARQMKIKGTWMNIDPRRWSDEMAVKVHVGMAAASRSQQIANLEAVIAKQGEILKLAGPGNPIVGVQELRNACAEQVQAMGYKDASRFFKEVDPNYKPEQQQDPKLVEAQMKAQLQAQEQQANQRLQEQKMASERELAVFKAQSEQQLAVMRLQMEEKLAIQRMEMEAQLDLRRQNMEAAQDERRMGLEASQAERDSQRNAATTVIAAKENAKAKAKMNGNGKTAIKKNRPGGDLAK